MGINVEKSKARLAKSKEKWEQKKAQREKEYKASKEKRDAEKAAYRAEVEKNRTLPKDQQSNYWRDYRAKQRQDWEEKKQKEREFWDQKNREWEESTRKDNIYYYQRQFEDANDFIQNPDQYRASYAYAQDYDADLPGEIARREEAARQLKKLGYQPNTPARVTAQPAPMAAPQPAPMAQPASMAIEQPSPMVQPVAAPQPVYELPQEPIAVAQPQQPAPQPPQPAPQPTGLASLPPQRMSQAEIDAYAKTYNAYTPNTQISTGTYDPALEQKLGMTLNQVLQPNTTTTMKRGGYVKPKAPVKKKSGYVSKNQSKTASRRGDGIAQRGKTRGRMV